MLNRLDKQNAHRHQLIMICGSIFLLLYLQLVEATHQHSPNQEPGEHHCLVCQKLQHSDQFIDSTFSSFSVLACIDERIVNRPLLNSSQKHLFPRSRSPPVVLL